MKIKLQHIVSVLAIVGSLIIPTAAAYATDSSTESHSGNMSTSSDDSKDSEKEASDRTERIKQFKADFKVKLTALESAHLKLKCVGAQSVVGKLHTRFGNSVTVRTKAYEALQKNLDNLVEKLKVKSVDTAALETQITELKAKITTYSTDLTAYKQTLSDLSIVDCKTDPDGFQAALLAARSAHEKLVTDVLAIRVYLKDTLKPSLQTIKTQLEASEKNSSSESEGSN